MRLQLMGVSVERPDPCKVTWHVPSRRLHLNVVEPSRPVSTNCKHRDKFYAVVRPSTTYGDLLLEGVGVGGVCVEGGASSATVACSLRLVGTGT